MPALLGIDRDAEHANTRGRGRGRRRRRVVDYRPDLGVLVIELPDRHARWRTPPSATPTCCAAPPSACRRLHAGPRFAGDFDMFRRQAAYLATVRERGYRLFDGYADHADAFERVRRRSRSARGPRSRATTTCWPATSSTTATGSWLIDYEYSGNNDACFELGNTATECDLDDDQVEALVAAYFGEVRRRDLLARVRLQSLVSRVRLVALGIDPGLGQHPRLRLRGLGAGALRQGGRDVPRAALRRLLDEVTGG